MGYRVWVSKSWWKVEVGSALQVHVKCPLLLPKIRPVTDAIFNYSHQTVAHGGRGQTWQRTDVESVRILGYWWKFSLQKDNPYLSDMMQTKWSIKKQKITVLFAQRIMEPQSFTYCGLDLFGPFYIMVKRSEIKIMLCYVHMYGYQCSPSWGSEQNEWKFIHPIFKTVNCPQRKFEVFKIWK